MSVDPVILGSAASPADTATPTGAAGAGTNAPAATAEGKKLAQLATEFESMLMLQMLREMRKAGSWKDESDEKGFGAETLLDTLDVELASHLTKAQGFGLEKSLVRQVSGQPAGGLGGSVLPASLPTLPSLLPAGFPVTPDAPPSPMAEPLTVADRQMTSPFGWRRDPFTGAAAYHRGVDVRAAYGEPVAAAAAGRVVFAGEQGGYGQTVVVEHGDGVQTRYAHLSSVLTTPGTDVAAGEAVGRAGSSGRSTGTHLHFEVTRDGRAVDPLAITLPVLKPEGVVADWAVGVGPDLSGPGSPDQSGRRR